MMFYDRFKQLCDQKGVSCNKAALEIGLSNAIVPKWKKTGATPSGETLNRIAKYFDVSVDFLLGQRKSPIKNDGQIDIEEKLLIQKYRALDERGRAAVWNVLEHEYNSLPGEKTVPVAKKA